MNDKYEEMARQYTRDRHGEHTGIASNVADAFRWYYEQREKETCEVPSHIGYHISWWKYCPICSQRLPEAK